MHRLVPLLVVLLGCASAPPADPADPAETRSPLTGVWTASDPEVGALSLTIKDAGDGLECVLVDVRGAEYPFDAEPEDDGQLELELEPVGKGLQVLICRPATSLEVAGSMNYAQGRVVLTITPLQREGRPVAFLQFHRPQRKDDTLRGVNLLREGPTPR